MMRSLVHWDKVLGVLYLVSEGAMGISFAGAHNSKVKGHEMLVVVIILLAMVDYKFSSPSGSMNNLESI